MTQEQDREFRLRYQLDQKQREVGALRIALVHILEEGQLTPELRRQAYLALGDGGKVNA